MESIHFLIRADASRLIGSGHIVRCMTLAATLVARGHQVVFVCRTLPGHMQQLLQDRGFPVSMLPIGTERALESVYDEALQLRDCQETLQSVDGQKIDYVLVDHYGLDAIWQAKITAQGAPVAVIDDIANRAHSCDLLVDPNYSLSALTKYDGLVPERCRQMVGPKYALLHRRYATLRKNRQPSALVKRVFVYFGGTDKDDVTGMAVRALLHDSCPKLSVDVVVGGNYAHYQNLTKIVEQHDRVTLYGPQKHLADLMINADLAIGAGGGTTWERMCLGIPSIIVSLAENQELACRDLAQVNLIAYLGSHNEVTENGITCAVSELVEDRQKLAELSSRSMIEVDGLGVLRIAEQLDPTPKRRLKMKQAKDEDVHLYFNWANDISVRANALDAKSISWKEHKSWFHKRLNDETTTLLLLCALDLPVGQIRFETESNHVRVSYSLDQDYRGRRWGKLLVGMGLLYFCQHQNSVFRAEVKTNNKPSIATLEGLGFEISRTDSSEDVLILYLDSDKQALVPLENLVN